MPAGLDLLARLSETHAFDPVALPGYRTDLYLPFERLLGGEVETALRLQARETQRIALIGPVGCGKSSLAEYAFGEIGEGFAPIWVSAAHEQERTVEEPGEFARHLIRVVVGWTEEIGAMTREQREAFLSETSRMLPSRSSSRRQSFGLKAALGWLSPEYSEEIVETLANPELERSQAAVVESLDRLVELILDDLERVPIVIVDDSDRWLRIENGPDRSGAVEPFFRETCRMLAERNWAVVVAVHPDYLSAPGFQEARRQGYLNRVLEVPRLPEAAALERLLTHRIESRVDDASAVDVFETEAIEQLYAYYVASANLRLALTIVDQALREAVDGDVERISASEIHEAALGIIAA